MFSLIHTLSLLVSSAPEHVVQKTAHVMSDAQSMDSLALSVTTQLNLPTL